MNYKINWDKVNSLPKKEKQEFMETLNQAKARVLDERMGKQRKNNLAYFFLLIIFFSVLFVLIVAWALWLLTLISYSINFSWVFVVIVSFVFAAIVSGTIIYK